jgi:hypothetical protein
LVQGPVYSWAQYQLSYPRLLAEWEQQIISIGTVSRAQIAAWWKEPYQVDSRIWPVLAKVFDRRIVLLTDTAAEYFDPVSENPPKLGWVIYQDARGTLSPAQIGGNREFSVVLTPSQNPGDWLKY